MVSELIAFSPFFSVLKTDSPFCQLLLQPLVSFCQFVYMGIRMFVSVLHNAQCALIFNWPVLCVSKLQGLQVGWEIQPTFSPYVMAGATDAMSDRLSIPAFFCGKNVFITGATGFMGKVLLEKLLRSCPDIGLCYVLVRPKKGVQPSDRIKQILDSKVGDIPGTLGWPTPVTSLIWSK